MANTILYKRSDTPGKIPNSGDLQSGELAINTNDGKLYLKKDNSSIVNININEIGSLQFFISNPDPNNWINCDGSTYSKSSYPNLANYLGSNIVNKISLPSSGSWNNVIWDGNNYCLAGGPDIDYYLKSVDAINWSGVQLPTTGNWTIRWNGSKYCIFAGRTNFFSNNGISWTSGVNMPYADDNNILMTSNSSVFLTAQRDSSAGIVFTTADGSIWTTGILPNPQQFRSLSSHKEVLLCYSVTITNPNICYSTNNGITWNQTGIPYSAVFDFSSNNNIIVGVGQQGVPSIIYSYNGLDWSMTPAPLAVYTSVVNGVNLNSNSVFVAKNTNASDSLCSISSDGLSWKTFRYETNLPVVLSDLYAPMYDSGNFRVPFIDSTNTFTLPYYIKT